MTTSLSLNNIQNSEERSPQLGSPVGSGLLWASWANFVSVLDANAECCHVGEALLNAGGRRWIHPADALQKGHVAYLVKFLGFTEVEQSKGIEVVREGIRKLKFNQQLKRSEGGKRIFHQHPLHRISYCADDKTDKKSFSFIAKESDGERHSCFVFSSEKLVRSASIIAVVKNVCRGA
ncbi:hypothetical protein HPB51_024658 [Rhipicephalus microplus]|uniref:PID domain-containing protein n=1 Tax=Rhipicephalus microplus TaxID=6941 RepID=A0A9J6DRG9_RHIMP|nr:hypothetical protein HPB51_024658 [Rhipicephalus microplus]